MIIAHAIDFAVFLTRARCDVDLAADDGLDALFLCFFIKIDDAIHRTVVSDGNAVHAKLFCRLDEFLDAARAVKQRKFCMDMKMGKWHKPLLPEKISRGIIQY